MRLQENMKQKQETEKQKKDDQKYYPKPVLVQCKTKRKKKILVKLSILLALNLWRGLYPSIVYPLLPFCTLHILLYKFCVIHQYCLLIDTYYLLLRYIAKHARLPRCCAIPSCHGKFCIARTFIWTWFRPCYSICCGILHFNSINTLLYCV